MTHTPLSGNNILDSQKEVWQPFQKKKKAITLIVGAVCKDAIVLGAESETTRDYAKYHGTKKISIVDFQNGSVMVGEAGIQHLSVAVVDGFSKIARDTTIENEESIIKALEKSFREISSRTIAPRSGTKTCQNFYRQEINYFEITLAFYYDGKPYIYILNPVFGIAVKCRERFSRSGIGKDLAEYLLKDVSFEGMDARSATIEIAHVVREVKTSVSGCGGNTEIALVSDGNKPEKLNQPALNDMEEKILFLSKKRRSERRKSVEELKESVLMQYQSGLNTSVEEVE